MAEDLQNPDNVQAAAGNPATDGEEYEYEYIELAEGEELPEDFICPLCKHTAADFEPIG